MSFARVTVSIGDLLRGALVFQPVRRRTPSTKSRSDQISFSSELDPHPLTEASVLLGYGVVAVRSAPPLHPAQTAAKAVLRRLLRHHPSALSGQPPVERHAQQVEAALLLLGLGVLGARTRWREAHQPRLVGMQT